MDLLVHRIHRVLRQRLDVFGAAESAQTPYAGVDHPKIGTVAFPNRVRSTWVGRLPALEEHLALVARSGPGDVSDPPSISEKPITTLTFASGGRRGNGCEFRTLRVQRIGVVPRHELHTPGWRAEPKPPG